MATHSSKRRPPKSGGLKEKPQAVNAKPPLIVKGVFLLTGFRSCHGPRKGPPPFTTLFAVDVLFLFPLKHDATGPVNEACEQQRSWLPHDSH